MDNVPSIQVEARLAQIRRQKANLEHLVELEREEQHLMALQGGSHSGHLPTPANLMQSTEMPTPTPGRVINAVDLTTPPPPMQQVKREPKEENNNTSRTADIEEESDQQNHPPNHSEFLPHQQHTSRGRQRGHAGGPVFADSPLEHVSVHPHDEFPVHGRPARKKKRQSNTLLTPVVDDVEYRNIIKAPNGEDEGLVEVACKFCEANCGIRSGVKMLFKGDSAWRGHIAISHRRDLPAGTKLSTSYLVANCLTMRKLTQREVDAVLHHKHNEFAVYIKTGLTATKSNRATRKRISRRSAATAATVSGEDTAEREILEAIEDPLKIAIASIDAMDEGDMSVEHDEEGGELDNLEDGLESRTLAMATRNGGRRTRHTPDFMTGQIE